MRTAAICPTCATYENALCILYNGPYLPYTTIQPLDSLEVALQKIDAAFVTPVTSVTGVSPIVVTGTYTPVISVLNASATQSGVVTTGVQTFAGAKTFIKDLKVNSLTIGQGAVTGVGNTALGIDALKAATTGGENVAVGAYALDANTTGNQNTAVGLGAMGNNTTGKFNTALGFQSLYANTDGADNTAIGQGALQNVTTGDYNTAIGRDAGKGITTGNNNTIIGAQVTGLSPTLSDTVIIANGQGAIRIKVNSLGITNVANVPVYADNLAALLGGLVAGDIYRTGDILKIVH